MAEPGWTTVAATEDVIEGAALAVEAGGRPLALYRVEDALFCTANVCTHAHALLSDGWLEGHVIECPLHAGQFDIRTGQALGPPVEQAIAVFEVRCEAGRVLVRLP